MLKKTAGACFLFALAMLCAACAPRQAYGQFFAMNTTMELTIWGAQADEALLACKDEIARLEGLFSVSRKNSDITRLNEAGGEPVRVSGETAELFTRAREISIKTQGAFSVTVEGLVRAYGFESGRYRLPDENELEELLGYVGDAAIGIEGDSVTLPAGTLAGLGGVAKGYAAGRLEKILAQYNVDGAVLSLGGNVQTYGQKPAGGLWKIGLKDPASPGEIFAVVEVEETMAVVTSGGYERYFVEDGVRYHHIINPADGRPANSGLLSVTVICRDATLADALSTAFFVMGENNAMAYARRHGGLCVVMVTADGRVVASEGLRGAIGLEKGDYTLDFFA